MNIFNLKIDKRQEERLAKAQKDFKKIQAEIAPYIKKRKYSEESREDGWHKTSTFLLS